MTSLDLIFVVIFLYLNNQDKFEKDKKDAFDDTENKPNDALVDDIENKPDDHSSLDNKKDAFDDTEKFVPGEEFVFILDSGQQNPVLCTLYSVLQPHPTFTAPEVYGINPGKCRCSICKQQPGDGHFGNSINQLFFQ